MKENNEFQMFCRIPFLFILSIVVLIWAFPAFASCPCTIGSQASVIGTEYIAKDCPNENWDESQGHTYIASEAIYCTAYSNGIVVLHPRYGRTYEVTRTPASLVTGLLQSGVNPKVIRNKKGDHIWAISQSFKGSINGVSIASLPSTSVETGPHVFEFPIGAIPDEINIDDDEDGYTVCEDCDDGNADKNPKDNDGDGVTACDDCDDNDKEKTTGDSCYTDAPDDNGQGPGPGGDGGPGGGGDDDDDDDDDCGSEDNQNFKGNPINLINGNKYERHRDLVFPSAHRQGMEFRRYYNSQSSAPGSVGYGWTHTYSIKLTTHVVIDGIDHIRIQDMTGQGRYFAFEDGSLWRGVFKDETHVIAETDGTYSWHQTDGTVFRFDNQGRLTAVIDAYANRNSMTYDTANRLNTVTDESSGRVLTVHYNADNRIESIEGPVTAAVTDGIWVEYGYDAQGNLTTVDYADGSGVVYEYTDPNDAHNLTARRDKENHLIASWTYDDQDRATASINRSPKLTFSIEYVDENTVSVTDAYGTSRTHTLTYYDGHFPRVTDIGGTGCSTCTGHLPVRYEYDNDFNVLEKEYADGRIVSYSNYNTKGRPGTRVRGLGTEDEQAVTYTYHPILNTLLSRREASILGDGDKVTIWDYDDDGDNEPNENPTLFLSRKIDSGYTKNQAGEVVPYEYISTYIYNGKGKLTSMDGALAGTDDTITYAYDDTTGDLLSITRPLVGSTTFGNYDGAGNPGHMIDENGQMTDYTYDGRNRLLTTTRSTLSTSQTYRPSGDLFTKTDTGGRTLTYTYDATHGRLTRVTDDSGNYLLYNYDNQGNRIEDSVYDATNTRTRWQRFDFQHPDFPGKLWKIINPDDSEIVYGYDSMGRMASVIDERLRTTTYQYDPLNRLESFVKPGNVKTTFDYDARGNRISVTDPNTNETSYTYDDYGRVLTENSPDRGTTTYVYEVSTNRVLTTDANGVTVIKSFDALGRPVSVSYPSEPSVSMAYDTGSNAMGRLISVADQAGQTSFSYNTLGRVSLATRGNTGLPDAVVSYDYSPTTGDLTTLTYPSGMVLSYGYDIAGRLSSIQSNGENVVSSITYRPFGPVEDYTLGDSLLVMDQTFTLRDQVERIQAGTMDYQYQYYADGTVKNISGVPFPSELFTDSTFFAYQDGSNMLDSSSGGQTKAYTNDAYGNITSDGMYTYVYNQSNRLVQVKQGETVIAQYAYDFQHRRVRKITSKGIIYYHYDIAGHLISETDGAGNPLRDYIYIGNKPISMKLYGSQAGIYYILSDHLGTPQQIVDKTGAVVWQAYYMPYGEVAFISETITFNLRFPGQYYDSETGLHYNWNRYYDPGTGRYLTPDPIGLEGGINLYSYVNGNPIMFQDITGLKRCCEDVDKRIDDCVTACKIKFWECIDGCDAAGDMCDEYFQKKAECDKLLDPIDRLECSRGIDHLCKDVGADFMKTACYIMRTGCIGLCYANEVSDTPCERCCE